MMSKNCALFVFSLLLTIEILSVNPLSAANRILPSPAPFELERPPGDILRAEVFITISPSEFSAATGKKLNFFDRIVFRSVQKRMKRDYRHNPDLLITEYYDPVKAKFKLDVLWFTLGVLIGPLAILFAYTSKRNKISRKSALLGLVVFIAWFGLLFLF